MTTEWTFTDKEEQTADRLRQSAAEEKLLAENAFLKDKLLSLKLVVDLRKIGVEEGFCPICRGPVSPPLHVPRQ
jgi:hypothetical protein